MTIPKLLRFADLEARGIVTNWPTLKRWVAGRGFPPGRRIGEGRIWTEQEVAEWLASLPLASEVAPPLKGAAKELSEAKRKRGAEQVDLEDAIASKASASL